METLRDGGPQLPGIFERLRSPPDEEDLLDPLRDYISMRRHWLGTSPPPLPPHMDLWEELAEVQLCSRILRSDRKLNFSCHETLAPLPATLKVEHGMAAPSMAAAAVSVAASQGGGCEFDSSSGLFQLFKSQRWTGGAKG